MGQSYSSWETQVRSHNYDKVDDFSIEAQLSYAIVEKELKIVQFWWV